MRPLLIVCCCAWLAAADWPSARGPLGTGLAPDGPAPPLRRLWRAQLGGAVGQPAISGDRAVVAALQRGLVCVSMADGHELWRTPAEREPLTAPPLIAGDAVVAGDEGGVVRCWTLADGTLRWERKLEGKVLGGAARAGDLILVGSYDQKLHALSLADGAERWVLATDGPVHAGPAVQAEQVVIAGCDGQVRRAMLADGRQTSLFDAGTNIGATPLPVAGGLLIAVLDGRWLCLDGATTRWKGAAEGDRFERAGAADAAVAVLTAREGTVRALAVADGAQRWEARLGVGIEASPLLAGGHVWIADAGGELRALALADGRETWRTAIGSPLSDPVAAGGRLLVGAADGNLWCWVAR